MDVIRPGDVVTHVPSGEQWVVAAVNDTGTQLSPMGWPETIADTQDVVLTDDADFDAMVDAMRRCLALPSNDIRRQWTPDSVYSLDMVWDQCKQLIDQSWYLPKREVHMDQVPVAEALLHLHEEVGELSTEITRDKDPARIREEFADVLMVLLHIGVREGITIPEIVQQVEKKIRRVFVLPSVEAEPSP